MHGQHALLLRSPCDVYVIGWEGGEIMKGHFYPECYVFAQAQLRAEFEK